MIEIESSLGTFAAPFAFRLREEPFAITGATAGELRQALSILGPLRDGARYAAFTDWEVTYRVRPFDPLASRPFERSASHPFDPAAPHPFDPPASRPASLPTSRPHVDVGVLAVVRLPHLRPPLGTSPALVERWNHYVDALRRHERGHVAIARAAARAVLEALSELPPSAPPPIVARAASAALAEIRAAERAYDVDTRHGASQGAVFFS